VSDPSLKLFENLDYPGRRKPVGRSKKATADVDTPVWSDHPITKYEVGGKPCPLYEIGDLAKAIGYSVQSIRAWETAGVFPAAPYRSPRTKGPVAAGTSNMGRRLWTRGHIEAILRVAKKQKVILSPHRRPPTVAFARAVEREFYELSLEHEHSHETHNA